MNLLLQWFRSPEWQPIVKTLLHTLWQGAVVAVMLLVTLSRQRNPVTRYRSSFASMIGVLDTGVVTWAVLSHPEAKPVATTGSLPAVSTASPATPQPIAAPTIAAAPSVDRPPVSNHWTAWLAFVWFSGAAVMLMRAG